MSWVWLYFCKCNSAQDLSGEKQSWNLFAGTFGRAVLQVRVEEISLQYALVVM